MLNGERRHSDRALKVAELCVDRSGVNAPSGHGLSLNAELTLKVALCGGRREIGHVPGLAPDKVTSSGRREREDDGAHAIESADKSSVKCR